eukprot:PhF_6_TR21048/c1_g1_i2/m.30296
MARRRLRRGRPQTQFTAPVISHPCGSKAESYEHSIYSSSSTCSVPRTVSQFPTTLAKQQRIMKNCRWLRQASRNVAHAVIPARFSPRHRYLAVVLRMTTYPFTTETSRSCI